MCVREREIPTPPSVREPGTVMKKVIINHSQKVLEMSVLKVQLTLLQKKAKKSTKKNTAKAKPQRNSQVQKEKGEKEMFTVDVMVEGDESSNSRPRQGKKFTRAGRKKT